MYHIAVCDDDQHFMGEFCQKLTEVLSLKNVDASIEKFYDTVSFLKRLNQGISFDLVFLDILLGKENGYHFAKYLRDEKIQTDLIFITITEDYAVMGYDVSPLLYLVKPIKDAQLEYACDIFLKKHQPSQVILKFSGETLSFNITDLLYCEISGHMLSLHLASGISREIRHSLSKLEKQLPANLFARSHQSYLVNMSHISSITRYVLTLSTGQTLPISQSRYMELQNKFLLYSSHQNIRI